MKPTVFALMACVGLLSAQPVTFTGSVRTRVEAWNWFDAPGADGDYVYSGTLARFAVGQTGKRVSWQIELAAPILLGLPDNAIASGNPGQLGLGATYYVANDRNQNTGMVFAKQGWVRFGGLGGKESTSLRLGRFEFNDGSEVVPGDATLAWLRRERLSQRLLGNFGWTHVGRSLDGAQFVWAGKKLNFTAVGAQPTRGVFQVDGWGRMETAVGYAALSRAAAGKTQSYDYRVFGSWYDDWRDIVKTDNRALALRQQDFNSIRIFTGGGHYLHRAVTRAGTWDGTVWTALQTGTWGALDHRAWAWLAEGGFQPAVLPKLKPWLRVGYSHTSGDDNPTDGKHGTFFQILPTPRPYARFPFFNMMNNVDLSGALSLRPGKALTVRSEVHGLRLASGRDFWYQGGGAYQPWTFGYVGRNTAGNRGLATLYDVSADYVVNGHVSVSGYFGYAVGHSAMRAVYPTGKDGSLGYVELTWKF